MPGIGSTFGSDIASMFDFDSDIASMFDFDSDIASMFDSESDVSSSAESSSGSEPEVESDANRTALAQIANRLKCPLCKVCVSLMLRVLQRKWLLQKLCRHAVAAKCSHLFCRRCLRRWKRVSRRSRKKRPACCRKLGKAAALELLVPN